MSFFLVIWCAIVIPMVSLVDGGLLGAFFVGGLRGFIVGSASTASILYGQVIWMAASHAR
jgi:hypothetical protein